MWGTEPDRRGAKFRKTTLGFSGTFVIVSRVPSIHICQGRPKTLIEVAVVICSFGNKGQFVKGLQICKGV